MSFSNDELYFRKWGMLCFWLFIAVYYSAVGLFEFKESYALGAFNLMSWLWLILGLIGIGGFVSDFRKKQIIRIEGDKILFGFVKGKSSLKIEPITSIDRDQVEYHLYSEKNYLSIKIKRIPEDFRELVDDRCDAGSG